MLIISETSRRTFLYQGLFPSLELSLKSKLYIRQKVTHLFLHRHDHLVHLFHHLYLHLLEEAEEKARKERGKGRGKEGFVVGEGGQHISSPIHVDFCSEKALFNYV